MPEQMTITIDGGKEGLDAKGFMSILNETFRLLDSMEGTQEDLGHGERGWKIVDLTRQNPAKITIASLAGIHIFGALIGGIRDIEAGPASPFPEPVMHRVEHLGRSIAKHDHLQVTLETQGGDSVTPTSRTKDHAHEAIGVKYYTLFGSAEGILDVLEVTRRMQFVVYDESDGHRIICKFDEGLEKQVKQMIGKRVLVSGAVKYKKSDDLPVRIDAEEIEHIGREPLRFADLPAIDLTGEESSEDYIRRMRDAE